MLKKPYESKPGLFRFARSATTWLPDIEAYLVEQDLTTELAPTVAALIDTSGWTLEQTVTAIKSAMSAYGAT